MNKPKQTRRVSSEKLRAILAGLADEICRAQDRVLLAMNGNTFEIHLEGGTLNLTINEAPAAKGGAA